MPAIAVMAIEPARTVSNSSVPGCSVSRREKVAHATREHAAEHDQVGEGLHDEREAEEHARVLAQGRERATEDRAERQRVQRDDPGRDAGVQAG